MTRFSDDRDRALALTPALAAIVPQLDIYEALLRRWQAKINLIGPTTLEHLWTRHFADSAQLAGLLPPPAAAPARLVDLGSGAGFPGLVLALLRPDIRVTTIESDTRKAAFLREVSRETGANAEVVTDRAEAVVAAGLAPDSVTSRALAPLPRLVALAKPWLYAGSVGRFLVGEAEVLNAPELCITRTPSRTGSGFVVTVRRRDSGQE